MVNIASTQVTTGPPAHWMSHLGSLSSCLWVYLLTHSAIALGLIGLFQAVPRILFSLLGGVFADVLDRRKLLLVIEGTLAALSAVLALCTLLHVINMFEGIS